MPGSTIDAAKQAVRERVWNLLEAEHAVDRESTATSRTSSARPQPPSAWPASPWRDAQIVKAVPDTAQLPVRARALADGKIV